MRDVEASLQGYGEFLLKARLVKERAAAHCARWVRAFLKRPASAEPLDDQVRRFCEDLERQGHEDWQVRQAEDALRIYFVNFRQCADWRRRPQSTVVDPDGCTNPLAANSSNSAQCAGDGRAAGGDARVRGSRGVQALVPLTAAARCSRRIRQERARPARRLRRAR